MMTSKINPNQFQQKTSTMKNRLTLEIPNLETPITGDSPRSARSPFNVPMQYERFAQSFIEKNNEGLFLGRTPIESGINRRQYGQICRVAKNQFLKGPEELEPTRKALDRTKNAIKDFFALSCKLLDKQNMQFPLAGRNKCLGMVAVPESKLVIIAISQDKNPAKDELLRTEVVAFLYLLNTTTQKWVFELACIPTKAQYLMPRTISMRTPQAASELSVKPHTRCVEVALMAALCKAGRTRKFTSADTGIIAFSGTLWASPDRECAEAIPHFKVEGLTRNTKYTTQKPINVVITKSVSGWIDIWDPCPEHCKIYKYEMLAIGASGGYSSSFFEPRSEGELSNKSPKEEKNMLTNHRLMAVIVFGAISAAICGTGIYLRAQNKNEFKDMASMALLVTAGIAGASTIMASFSLLFATNYKVAGNRNNAAETALVIVSTDDSEATPRSRSASCSF